MQNDAIVHLAIVAYFNGGDLTGANLRKVNLSGANLSGAFLYIGNRKVTL